MSVGCNFDAWPLVNDLCRGKHDCGISISEEVFGNVCPKMKKKLVVSYKCQKGDYFLIVKCFTRCMFGSPPGVKDG